MADMARRLLESNAECIHAGRLGYGCRCLWAVDEGCQDGTCPFFKTEEDQKVLEDYCRKRCRERGIAYRTREEVFTSYNKVKERKRKYYDTISDR